MFKLKCKEFVCRNALSFAFSSTSLESSKLRSITYTILSKFLAKLKDLNDEMFPERPLYIFILKLFKHSIKEVNQKVCNGNLLLFVIYVIICIFSCITFFCSCCKVNTGTVRSCLFSDYVFFIVKTNNLFANYTGVYKIVF